jgi:hypothetical protein
MHGFGYKITRPGGRVMGTKDRELVESLSEDEQDSLQRLCRCSCSNQNIPGEHAEKLLRLNLAEMTCGGLGPTAAGRNAAATFLKKTRSPQDVPPRSAPTDTA